MPLSEVKEDLSLIGFRKKLDGFVRLDFEGLNWDLLDGLIFQDKAPTYLARFSPKLHEISCVIPYPSSHDDQDFVFCKPSDRLNLSTLYRNTLHLKDTPMTFFAQIEQAGKGSEWVLIQNAPQIPADDLSLIIAAPKSQFHGNTTENDVLEFLRQKPTLTFDLLSKANPTSFFLPPFPTRRPALSLADSSIKF